MPLSDNVRVALTYAALLMAHEAKRPDATPTTLVAQAIRAFLLALPVGDLGHAQAAVVHGGAPGAILRLLANEVESQTVRGPIRDHVDEPVRR